MNPLWLLPAAALIAAIGWLLVCYGRYLKAVEFWHDRIAFRQNRVRNVENDGSTTYD